MGVLVRLMGTRNRFETESRSETAGEKQRWYEFRRNDNGFRSADKLMARKKHGWMSMVMNMLTYV